MRINPPVVIKTRHNEAMARTWLGPNLGLIVHLAAKEAFFRSDQGSVLVRTTQNSLRLFTLSFYWVFLAHLHPRNKMEASDVVASITRKLIPADINISVAN